MTTITSTNYLFIHITHDLISSIIMKILAPGNLYHLEMHILTVYGDFPYYD